MKPSKELIDGWRAASSKEANGKVFTDRPQAEWNAVFYQHFAELAAAWGAEQSLDGKRNQAIDAEHGIVSIAKTEFQSKLKAHRKAGYEQGWADCMAGWADHMKRMNAAMKGEQHDQILRNV